MNREEIELSGKQLFDAYETHVTIPPLTRTYPDITVDNAYAIQQVLRRYHEQAGRKVIGRKIGLTSQAMRQQANVYEPDYGFIFDTRSYPNGGVIPRGELIQPKVECELAFILKKDLVKPHPSQEDILDATDYVVAALEIVDKRYHDFYGHICDNVSDNAFFGAYILGDRILPPRAIDMEMMGLTLEMNGKLANTGIGAAVMGNPAAGVAWLANRMCEVDMPLKAGEIVLSGSFIGAEYAHPGDYFRATFSKLGDVSIMLESEPQGGGDAKC